jgi:hypothetical protein
MLTRPVLADGATEVHVSALRSSVAPAEYLCPREWMSDIHLIASENTIDISQSS